MKVPRRTAVCLRLAAGCLAVYAITSYGGIRSPDSEIVFRTSEALVTRGSFAIERGIETWEGFGLARGVDGRQYSIFGPGQALLAAPLVAVGRGLAGAGLFGGDGIPLPVSHYLGNGIEEFIANRPPADRDGSGVRWIATQLNVVVSTLSVVLFYLVACALAGSPAAALPAALIYGFGTLVWPYSGACFSEPLASLCALAAFSLLIANDPRFSSTARSVRRTVLAGACLGAAVLTHLSAILFAPFFLLYALHPYQDAHSRRKLLAPALGFTAGLGVMLLLLGCYNDLRFGNPFETGRGVDPRGAAELGYGVFTNPLEGLRGLLFSPGKGLLLFNPVVVVAALAWGLLHRRHRFLANVLASALVFRIVFVAGRSDWHGGFCLGPRYLVMILPYLCLPLALLVKEVLQGGLKGRWALAVAGWLLICQQYYFALGEVFSHFRVRDWRALDRGLDILKGERIYLEWAYSPLTTLLDGLRGPLLLRPLPIGNHALFLLGCAVLGVVLVSVCRVFAPAAPGPDPQDGFSTARNPADDEAPPEVR